MHTSSKAIKILRRHAAIVCPHDPSKMRLEPTQIHTLIEALDLVRTPGHERKSRGRRKEREDLVLEVWRRRPLLFLAVAIEEDLSTKNAPTYPSDFFTSPDSRDDLSSLFLKLSYNRKRKGCCSECDIDITLISQAPQPNNLKIIRQQLNEAAEKVTMDIFDKYCEKISGNSGPRPVNRADCGRMPINKLVGSRDAQALAEWASHPDLLTLMEDMERRGGAWTTLELPYKHSDLWIKLGLDPPRVLEVPLSSWVDGKGQMPTSNLNWLYSDLFRSTDGSIGGIEDAVGMNDDLRRRLWTQLFSEKPEAPIPTWMGIRHKSTTVTMSPQVLEQVGMGDWYKGQPPQVQSNVAPCFTSVGPHIDMGAKVLSVALMGARKIWALWPPTEHNLRVFSEEEQPARFSLASKLEGATYTITSDNQGIYIPTMTIHATITLRGGAVSGVSTVDPSCLPWLERSWRIDKRLGLADRSYVYILQSIIMARDSNSDDKERAAAIFCALYDDVSKDVMSQASDRSNDRSNDRQLLKEARGLCSRPIKGKRHGRRRAYGTAEATASCVGCGKTWNHHTSAS